MSGRILVFGSLNMDVVLVASRHPHVGETLPAETLFFAPGGKGLNQAVAAARAGAEVDLFGAIGSDCFGVDLRAALARESLNSEGVLQREAPTGCASIWLNADGDNKILVAAGANGTVSADQVPDSLLTPDTVLVLQMEVPAAENWNLLRRAHGRGVRSLLNLAPAVGLEGGQLQQVLPLLSGLILNEGEAYVLGSLLGFSSLPLSELSCALTRRYGFWVAVTCGDQPAMLSENGRVWRLETLPLRAVDTTGAGDAFVGILAACLSRKMSLAEGLRMAVAGSGLACMTQGAVPSFPFWEEICRSQETLGGLEEIK